MIIRVVKGVITQIDKTVSEVPNDGGRHGWRVAPQVGLFPDMIEQPDGTFSTPDPTPPEPRRYGTFREFTKLFTRIELLGLKRAEREDDILTLWFEDARGGPFSLDHPSVAEGLAYLVSQSLLTEVRAAEINAADLDA